MNFLKGKSVFISGGTGSFGSKMLDCVKNQKLKKIIIFSRDEMKQWFLKEKYKKYKNIKFVIGDIRDLDRLSYSMKDCDYAVHAAATKIVPTAEKNPEECIKTNIIGGMNIIKASLVNNLKKVIALSTDKASSPINLYGATKLCSDKLFTSQYYEKNYTKFSVVRYGNVLGSRGSIIPHFLSVKKKGIFPLTHEDMTRFFLSLEDAVEFVNFCFGKMQGGEIFVKKLPSIKIKDLIKFIQKVIRTSY
jgi:FlaA1/EpsC-like NDP-sugar epimerase